MTQDEKLRYGSLPVRSIPNVASMARLRSFLPFLLILAWSCVVRLPFYGNINDDEFFFAVIAQHWLAGGLPYVSTYDVKPPGVFALYAMAQALFGESLATIKGLEIVFTALGGAGLYHLARKSGGPALWCSVLYPIYSLALSGVNAANLILQLPFLIFAFSALPKEGEEAAPGNGFVAGFMVGVAGMIRQAVVAEALCVLVLLLWQRRERRWRCGLSFVAGAALPALTFAAYFALEGHLADAWQAAVVAAIARSGGEVPVAHGAIPAMHLTAWDVVAGPFAMSTPIMLLSVLALLAWTRRERMRTEKPLLVTAGAWLLASLLDVMSARSMFSYYMMVTVPPLLLLSGLFVMRALDIGQLRRWQFALALAAACWPLIADRTNLFSVGANGSEDRVAAQRAADAMKVLGQRPSDRLLVVNRGLLVYVAARALPPTAYFHPKHLLCEFPVGNADPMRAALAARPRFVMLADPSLVRSCEKPERLAEVDTILKTNYETVETVTGSWDTYTLYQLRAATK
jgi:hypothetical protein